MLKVSSDVFLDPAVRGLQRVPDRRPVPARVFVGPRQPGECCSPSLLGSRAMDLGRLGPPPARPRCSTPWSLVDRTGLVGVPARGTVIAEGRWGRSRGHRR